MKILVVDDSGTMRTVIRRCLENFKVDTVVEAPDGQVALDLFNQTTFDLVLTDWYMPKRDGLSLLKEIRRQDAEIPVIMVTTAKKKENFVEAITAGVSDYLMKPFDNAVLFRKIEKWLCHQS